MPLQKGSLSTVLEAFIKQQNSAEQKDPDKAIKDFAEKIEELVFNAISNADITIQSGLVSTTGANGGGPVTCINTLPIKVVKGLS